MQIFQAVRRLAVCGALLATLAVTGAVPPAQAQPAAAKTTCRPPRTLPVPGGTPQALALDSDLNVLVVGTSSALVLLSSCSGKVLKVVPAGGVPTQLAMDEEAGRVMVLVQQLAGTTAVRLFDIARKQWTRHNVQLPAGADPTTLVVPAGTHSGLILDPVKFALWVVDTRSGKVVHQVRKLPVGLGLGAMGMDATRHRAFIGSTGPNQITVIDTTTWTVWKHIPLAGWPWELAVSVKTGRVFVATQDSSGHHAKVLSVLDTRSGLPLKPVQLPFAPQALVVNEKLGLLYVATQDSKGQQVLVLNASTGLPPNAHSAGPHGSTLTVDPRTGNVYYIDQRTGKISVLPASGGPSQPTKGTKASPTPTVIPTPIPTTITTKIVFPSQILFETSFARGWDSFWAKQQEPPGETCIADSNPGNQYVLTIGYSGACASNTDGFWRWSPETYANGAISVTFTLNGSAAVGMQARAGSTGSYSLADVVVGAQRELVCLYKAGLSQVTTLQCEPPTPLAPNAPRTLTLQAQGNVLAAYFNHVLLFSHTDTEPLLAPGPWAFYVRGVGSVGTQATPSRVSLTHLTLYQQ